MMCEANVLYMLAGGLIATLVFAAWFNRRDLR